ncbi:hypothetical protein SAMN05216413_0331 [Ruminococcaceae bacterium KH2T8]|nr:hypothetical protein SAMN05216413_0331 [Ruminococcaceae bacterium KH2T8]
MNGSYARRNNRQKKNDKAAAGWLLIFALLVTGMLAGTLSLVASMA